MRYGTTKSPSRSEAVHILVDDVPVCGYIDSCAWTWDEPPTHLGLPTCHACGAHV